MNRDDIIRMAREAGDVRCDCCLPEPEPYEMQPFLERFAALVVAAEREACARVVEEHAKNIHGYDKHEYAYVIRERGEE